jgi:hypothetical protein
MWTGRLSSIIFVSSERNFEMTTSIHALMAAEHAADLRRESKRWRSTVEPEQTHTARRPERAIVALRLAGPDEGPVVRRLASLNDAPPLTGQVLLALVDGEAVAALSLGDGRVVANPFLPTEAAVGLLRLRAQHLSVKRPRRRRFRTILRPRFA